MDSRYGGIIWTNHALSRLKERNIAQGDAYYTFQHPEQSRYATSQGAWIYYRTYEGQKIEVVAKENDRKEWVILSVWSRPTAPGSVSKSSGINWIDLLKKIIPGHKE